MKCTQRLYLTIVGTTLVAAGHREAGTLYAVPGDEIPQSAADKFGLVDGHLKGFDPEKEREPGPDKERKGGSDKGGGPKPDRPELTKIKGIGDATAKAFAAAGITTLAELAAVNPESPPTIEGLPAVFNLGAVVKAAVELVGASGGPV